VPRRVETATGGSVGVLDASGRPLRGICVSAATGHDVAFPVHTDGKGNYAISVPSGTYKVYFAGCADQANLGRER
jgi:hypothetical protein